MVKGGVSGPIRSVPEVGTLARLLVLTVMVKKIGYMGAIISRNMAVSLRMSAKSLHCFALQSNLLPFHQAKMMRPNMPVESGNGKKASIRARRESGASEQGKRQH